LTGRARAPTAFLPWILLEGKMLKITTIKNSLFGLFYVMTETSDSASPTTFAVYKAMFLVYVDFGQVLRVMSTPIFGWSVATSDVLRYFDLVWLISAQMERAIPRYIFFAFATGLVVTALSDALYVCVIFSGGKIQQLWPVKLLKVLVATTVTILFSTLVKWVLIPIECLVSPSRPSLTEVFHGPDGVCNPWNFPEVTITIPSLIVAALYMIFALITSLLSFEINPLARRPMASTTGIVENRWLATKIASTCLVYLSRYITSVASTTILLLLMIWTMHSHLSRLPFHNFSMNLLRGGVYATVTWLAFCSVVVSCINLATGGEPNEFVLTLNWFLAAGLPLAFLVGVTLVRNKRANHFRILDRIRGDFAGGHDVRKKSGGTMVRSDTTFSHRKGGGNDSSSVAESVHGAVELVKRSVYESFFDATWNSRKVFRTSVEVKSVVRSLLYQRDVNELPFLAFVMKKGLSEHPESGNLLTFQVLLLHFVFRERGEADAQERLNMTSHTISESYVQYALKQKSKQMSSGEKMGKGAVSAINLMEFDVSMDKARQGHYDCLKCMHRFWKIVRRRKYKMKQVDDLLHQLEIFDRSMASSKQEYLWLMDKYPTSVQVLHNYANFLNDVVNDFKESEEKRKQALSLAEESAGGGGSEKLSKREPDPQMEAAMGRSSQTSESESYRIIIWRYIDSLKHHILGAEMSEVEKLHLRVQRSLGLLVLLATAGFVFTAFFLFADVAKSNVEGIEASSRFRQDAMMASFLLRDLFLQGHEHNIEEAVELDHKMEELLEEMHQQHNHNYFSTPSEAIWRYYREESIDMITPIHDKWYRVKYSYWTLVNDYARMMQEAARVPVHELDTNDWSLVNASDFKKSFIFIQENSLRRIIPILEEVVVMYGNEVTTYGTLAERLVLVNTILNALVVCLMGSLILLSINRTIFKIQHRYVCCRVALSLPRAIASKIYMHYRSTEIKFKCMEDENAEKADIENMGDGELAQFQSAGDPVSGDWNGNQEGGDDEDHDEQDADDEIRPPISTVRRGSVELKIVSLTEDSVAAFKAMNELEAKPDPIKQYVMTGGESPAFYRITYDGEEESERNSADDEVANVLNAGSGDDSEESDDEELPGIVEGYSDYDPSVNDSDVDHGNYHLTKGKKEASKAPVKHPEVQNSHTNGQSRNGAEPFDSSEAHNGEGKTSFAATLSIDKPATGAPAPAIRSALKMSAESMAMVEQSQNAIASEQAMEDLVMRNSIANMASTRGISKTGDDAGVRRPASPKRPHSPVRFHQNLDKTSNENGDGEPKPAVGEASPERGIKGLRGLELVKVDDSYEKDLEEALGRMQTVYTKWHVYIVSIIVLLALSIFTFQYPARKIQELVNIAATLDIAGRRDYEAKGCAYLARELVLDDGLSRLKRQEISSALSYYLEAFEAADEAVRLGNSLGINLGADYRNEMHNQIMYRSGCPWRENATNCSLPIREGATDKGLFFVIMSFQDAIKTVLKRYGVESDEYSDSFKKVDRDANSEIFDELRVKEDRISLTKSDADVAFVIDSFWGDLNKGLSMIMHQFEEEVNGILESALADNDVLFGVYLSTALILFYGILFRNTLGLVWAEAHKTQRFILALPTQLLSKDEVFTLMSFFNDMQNQDEHDDLLQNVQNRPEAPTTGIPSATPEGSFRSRMTPEGSSDDPSGVLN